MPREKQIEHTPPPTEPTVLIVEDELRLRQFMTGELPKMGFKSIAFQSAEEALRQLQSSQKETDKLDFDIAILDLNLPVMDGLSCLRALRNFNATFPAIILTGFGDLQAAQKAIDLGVTSFLTKPCRLDELEQALSKAKQQLIVTWKQKLGHTDKSLSQITEDTERESSQTLADLQRNAIFRAIEASDGNRSAAAKQLGISRRTLYNKIAEYEDEGHDVP